MPNRQRVTNNTTLQAVVDDCACEQETTQPIENTIFSSGMDITAYADYLRQTYERVAEQRQERLINPCAEATVSTAPSTSEARSYNYINPYESIANLAVPSYPQYATTSVPPPQPSSINIRPRRGFISPTWEREDTVTQRMESSVAKIQESVSMLEMYMEENFTTVTTVDISDLCGKVNTLRKRLWMLFDKLDAKRRAPLTSSPN